MNIKSAINRLGMAAIAGPALFTLAWLILGQVSTGYTIFGTRIEPYSPIAQPISGLGMGDTAPIMNTAFVLGGLLLLAGVVGIVAAAGAHGSRPLRATCATLLAATPIGMIICGLFDLEAVLPHLIGFLFAAGVPVIGFPVAGRLFRSSSQLRPISGWLLIAGPVTLALFVGFFVTFDPTAGATEGISGLIQRILVTVVLATYCALGWLAFRRPR